ncbi:TetR/AcrR family transcriptional regulator [Geotalea toluenoxydans]|uniref:TetR/AcrR family transcriptional regulator n=1 Tax=Geotalea toluenoxydans TaxID=421624 RepID=UPI000A7D63B1|nr:helix-turn-helix domain-containing protein [Geotalea toluenoxydans]
MRINEQTKQENRLRILGKAAELFIAKGFEDCTTRDLALAAGLATGTLFNYFPSKETLAMTMVSRHSARVAKIISVVAPVRRT